MQKGRLSFLGGASALALSVLTPLSAFAATAAATADQDPGTETTRSDTVLEAVVVTSRQEGITNVRPTSTVSGLNQDLVEIPRSVTTLDSAMLKDVQIRNIHDLTAASPGVYTAAYFGVAGSLQLRGNLADNYYRGFKGIINVGYYETPMESVSAVEIVRGPVSPVYGASKVGGMVNLRPKTEVATTLKYSDKPSALLTGTLGSYGERKFTAEGGIPFHVGDNPAAIYGYIYRNDSDHYYRDFKPDDVEVQLGYSMDVGDKITINAGGRYMNQQGHLSSPGWNRLTQDLIDNGNYMAGQPLVSLVKSNPQGLLPADLLPFLSGRLRQTINPVTGVTALVNDYTKLDPATVKMVKLSRRNIVTSPLDINDNEVTTLYADLLYGHTGDTHQFQLQAFYDKLANDRYSSAGNGGYARAHMFEARASYIFDGELTPWLKVNAIVGGNIRRYNATNYDNFARALVIYDRNDLSVSATPDGIINPYVLLPPTQQQFDQKFTTLTNSKGLFLNADIALFERLHIMPGIRYDDYDIDTINKGLTSFGGALNTWYHTTATPTSWQISVNYETPFGLIPYATYAKPKVLETGNGGIIDPALVVGRRFLSPGKLYEVGAKGWFFNDKLYASVAWYKQERNQRDALSGVINQNHAKGVEVEARMSVTRGLNVIATYTHQKTMKYGPATIVLSAEELGLAGQNIYAAEYLVSTGNVASLRNGYEDKTIPNDVASIFATYTMPAFNDGQLKLASGLVWAGETSGVYPGAVKIPSYATVRASASYSWDRYTVDVAVENLFDKRYFYLGQDAYSEVAALPGYGRQFHVRLAAKF